MSGPPPDGLQPGERLWHLWCDAMIAQGNINRALARLVRVMIAIRPEDAGWKREPYATAYRKIAGASALLAQANKDRK